MAAHNELGRWGEELAARHLERQGFKILFRDWRCGHRDLDLIAQKEDEDLLVIVEVKTRRNERFGDASLAVTPQKIRSIIIATNAFVKTYQVHSRSITLFVLAENPFSVVSRTNYGVFQRLVCVEVEKFNFHS